MTFKEDTREIPLTRGLVAIVDAADYDALAKFKWCATRRAGRPGRISTHYAVRGMRCHEPGHKDGKLVLMHRQIVCAPRGILVDHRNGNGLMNVRSNLRFATPSQNVANQHSRRGLSPFVGVYWNRRREKWYASIKVDRRDINLGVFASETDAAIARDAASLRYFGEFASLNFPH